MSIRWKVRPARELHSMRSQWQALNRSGNPALEPGFMVPLLEHFGDETEVLATASAGGEPLAMAILSRTAPGCWQTFQPAQAPMGAWLQEPGFAPAELVTGLFSALPGFPLLIGITQLDPEIMARAVDEVMRATIGSPVLPRYASEDMEAGGVKILAGDLVMLDFSLANFDSRVFADPEKFDVTRTPNPHFTFGHGMRHCTGAPLVRVIMAVGFTALFSRLPGLDLAVPQSEVESRAGGKLAGGLERFPIRW